jgi:hypothetical protein
LPAAKHGGEVVENLRQRQRMAHGDSQLVQSRLLMQRRSQDAIFSRHRGGQHEQPHQLAWQGGVVRNQQPQAIL